MSFVNVVFAELKAIFTNFSVVFVVVIGSLLYAFLYPSPYKNDVVNSQKILIVDLDNTRLSNELAFLVNAAPQVNVIKTTSSMKDAKSLLEQERIYGILEIPYGFEAGIMKGVSVHLDYFANASYFLIYSAVINGILSASNELSDKIRLRRLLIEGGMNSKDVNLVEKDSIALFNPSLGYINYALAAILVFILHQTLIAGAGILGASQNEQNLSGIRGYWNAVNPLKLVLARICAFSMVYIVLFLLYFGLLFETYGVHISTDIVSFWCFSLAFIFCCASLGVLFGSLVNHPSLPTQFILVTSLPFIFMMGFIWPIDLLPKYIVIFVEFLPAFHGINGLIRLNQMGADLKDVMGHFYWLIALCVSFIILSVGVINAKRKKLNR